MKISTGLATGALVFSAGLLATAAPTLPLIRWTLVISWFLLFVAIVCGIFAHAAIPIMMNDRNYDLECRAFAWPARAHQVAFVFGIALLALTLVRLLFLEELPGQLAVPTAAQAVQRAELALGRGEVRTVNVELIKGALADRAEYAVWHVQFPAPAPQEAAQGSVLDLKSATADLFVDVATGRVTFVSPDHSTK